MDSNIRTLVEKAKQGDNSAFSTLYQMYYPKMKGICINILKEDKAVVDDLVQDAFILALVSLKDLKNPNRFSQWLTSITSNLALKYREKGNRIKFVPLSDMDENAENECAESQTSELSIQYDDIMEEIDNLPEGYKKIFNLSVLDGLSHQEIAKVLDIALHSSSSQLARAKSMLRNKLSLRAILVIFLVLIVIPIYKHFVTKKQLVSDNDTHITRKRKEKTKNDRNLASKNGTDSTNCTQEVAPSTNYHSTLTKKNIVATRIDSTGINHSAIIAMVDSLQDKKPLVADNNQDSVGIKDSVPIPNIYKETWVAENTKIHKKNKWQLLAVGSLGTTLVQNVYKIIKSNDISSEQPSGPGKLTTWEDYAQELHRITQSDPTAENVAMADIADHNSGEIIETEHHDKPITLGVAINKNIGKRWSLETGLQYSYLKSCFVLGTGSYRVDKEQKLHYIGVPLKLSYQFMKFKRLSTYGSLGASIQIPIYGKTNADYIVGDKSAYTTDWKLTLPVQWTVNTNIGIQYQFAPNLNLFVEPTMNWYIPNGSSIKNTWTERPFTFTVPFGIRFSW